MDNPTGAMQYGITWVDSKLFKINDKKFPKNAYFGICNKSKKPAFVEKFGLVTMIKTDVYTNSDTKSCEEQRRCICLSCEFNKVNTIEDLCKAMNVKTVKDKSLLPKLEESLKLRRGFMEQGGDFDWSEYARGSGYVTVGKKK